jgi:hypothetical protein
VRERDVVGDHVFVLATSFVALHAHAHLTVVACNVATRQVAFAKTDNKRNPSIALPYE